MSQKNKPPDDGRRHMPKMKCPRCGGRAIDVANTSLRNTSVLTQLSDTYDADYILECPRCHCKLGLSINTGASVRTEASAVCTMMQNHKSYTANALTVPNSK